MPHPEPWISEVKGFLKGSALLCIEQGLQILFAKPPGQVQQNRRLSTGTKFSVIASIALSGVVLVSVTANRMPLNNKVLSILVMSLQAIATHFLFSSKMIALSAIVTGSVTTEKLMTWGWTVAMVVVLTSYVYIIVKGTTKGGEEECSSANPTEV